MSGLSQPRSNFNFPWHVDDEPKSGLLQRLELFYKLCHLQWRLAGKCGDAVRPALSRVSGTLDQTILATALIVLPRVFAGWDAARPTILAHTRTLLPFIPLATPEEEALERDPVWELLAEFQALDPHQQDKAAKNVTLLWGHFEDSFGGLSGFLAEPQSEQLQYLDKLMTASLRMRPARGSEVAFHYVTVELMRQYVSCFRLERSDRAALSLAACVAGLINRGRMLTPALTDQTSAP